MPVINENDTTTTDEISFGDNDFLAAQVAILVGADRLVLLTDTDGLHTADPRSDPARRARPRGHGLRELEALEIGHAPSPLGSGGMRSKVVAAEMATAAGIPAVICSGLRDGVLGAALAGERGGHALRRRRRAPLELQAVAEVREARARAGSSSTPAPRARCARAGRACCRSASSRCEGEFEAGDAVEVARSATAARSARGSSTTRPPSCAASRG